MRTTFALLGFGRMRPAASPHRAPFSPSPRILTVSCRSSVSSMTLMSVWTLRATCVPCLPLAGCKSRGLSLAVCGSCLSISTGFPGPPLMMPLISTTMPCSPRSWTLLRSSMRHLRMQLGLGSGLTAPLRLPARLGVSHVCCPS